MKNVNFFKLGYGTKRQPVKYENPFDKLGSSIVKRFVESEKKVQQRLSNAPLGITVEKLDKNLESLYRAWAPEQIKKYQKAARLVESGSYNAGSMEYQDALRQMSAVENAFKTFNETAEQAALDKLYLTDPDNRSRFGGPNSSDKLEHTDEANNLLLEDDDDFHLFKRNASILDDGNVQYEGLYGGKKIYLKDFAGKYAYDLEDNYNSNSLSVDNYMFQAAQSNIPYSALQENLNQRITNAFSSVENYKQRRWDILNDDEFINYRLQKLFGLKKDGKAYTRFDDQYSDYVNFRDPKTGNKYFNYATEANEFLLFKMAKAQEKYESYLRLIDRKTGRKNPASPGKINLGKISFTGATEEYQGIYLGYVEPQRVIMFNKDLENLKLNTQLPHLLDNGFVARKVSIKDQEKPGEIPDLYEIYLDGKLYTDNMGENKFTFDQVKTIFGTGATTEAFLNNPNEGGQ